MYSVRRERDSKALYSQEKEVTHNMKRTLVFILLSGFLLLPSIPLHGADMSGHGTRMAGAAQMPEHPPMPGPGKKVPIGDGYNLTYDFDKPLKMGTVIMKVEIFTKEGKKDASLEVKADTDMPSMRGAHGTGDRVFKLSQKGDYLLPISIVMPGEWEIKLTVVKGGKVIFRGRYNFNV
jgi:hypothetical protein